MSNFKTEIMEKLFKLVNESKLNFSYSLDNNELKLVIKLQEEKPIEEVKPIEETNIDVYHLDYLINGISDSDSDDEEVKPIEEQKKKNKKPLWQYSVKLGWYQRVLWNKYDELFSDLEKKKITNTEYKSKMKEQREKVKSYFKYYPKFQKYEKRFLKMDDSDIMEDNDWQLPCSCKGDSNKDCEYDRYADNVYDNYIINDKKKINIQYCSDSDSDSD